MGMLKVGTTPPGPSEKRMVMKEKTAPRMPPTIRARAVICDVHGGSAAMTSSSVRSWSCCAAQASVGKGLHRRQTRLPRCSARCSATSATQTTGKLVGYDAAQT